MPIHEYQCSHCGHVTEHLTITRAEREALAAGQSPPCEACHSNDVTPLISAPLFYLVPGCGGFDRPGMRGINYAAGQAQHLDPPTPVPAGAVPGKAVDWEAYERRVIGQAKARKAAAKAEKAAVIERLSKAGA